VTPDTRPHCAKGQPAWVAARKPRPRSTTQAATSMGGELRRVVTITSNGMGDVGRSFTACQPCDRTAAWDQGVRSTRPSEVTLLATRTRSPIPAAIATAGTQRHRQHPRLRTVGQASNGCCEALAQPTLSGHYTLPPCPPRSRPHQQHVEAVHTSRAMYPGALQDREKDLLGLPCRETRPSARQRDRFHIRSADLRRAWPCHRANNAPGWTAGGSACRASTERCVPGARPRTALAPGRPGAPQASRHGEGVEARWRGAGQQRSGGPACGTDATCRRLADGRHRAAAAWGATRWERQRVRDHVITVALLGSASSQSGKRTQALKQ